MHDINVLLGSVHGGNKAMSYTFQESTFIEDKENHKQANEVTEVGADVVVHLETDIFRAPIPEWIQ